MSVRSLSSSVKKADYLSKKAPQSICELEVVNVDRDVRADKMHQSARVISIYFQLIDVLVTIVEYRIYVNGP